MKSEKEQSFICNFYWPCMNSLPYCSFILFYSNHPAILFNIFHYHYHACLVASVKSDSLHPCGLQSAGFSVYGIFQTRILERVAMPSSRGSSRPRDGTSISCIAGEFFTHWATWETLPEAIRWENQTLNSSFSDRTPSQILAQCLISGAKETALELILPFSCASWVWR